MNEYGELFIFRISVCFILDMWHWFKLNLKDGLQLFPTTQETVQWKSAQSKNRGGFQRPVLQKCKNNEMWLKSYFWYFQRTRSRSRSIGKYEGGSARLQKIKQLKQTNNSETNYQTIHGTGIEPRKPLRVAFSQVERVSEMFSFSKWTYLV